MLSRREQADKALLVSFEYVAEKAVPTKDNPEPYRNVPYIRIWMSKNAEIVRKVTEEDKARFRDRWEAFLKKEEVPDKGTPINLVPFATPANVSSCKAEKIYTVEQLVETPDERLGRAYLTNFKYMCKDWLDSQVRSGFLQELRSEIDALKAENATLREQLAGRTKAPASKRRGRPRKVKDDILDDDSDTG